MKKALLVAPCLLGALAPPVSARGVSPYLPLNLEPEIERQIERVLVLGDKPVMTRPIAAASVLDALPKACAIDQALCAEVRRYLGRYTQMTEITHASVAGATTSGATHVVPNSYGLDSSSEWQVSGLAYFQPSDYALLSLGGVAYEGDAIPTGSFLSVGFDAAQLDLGYRPHWFSPMTDSAMLISTEAATMPSVTLSNYRPLTRLGLTYEVFLARMSTSSNIVLNDGSNGNPITLTKGNPRLAGMHLGIEPVSGWALAFNRVMQYGGGERGGNSVRSLFDAFVQPSRFDNTNGNLTVSGEFGNQAASITSRFLFPGRTPFSVYFEYGGEDTSRSKDYLLGNSSLSAGIHFPRLFRQLDLTYEVSEWQNGWYSHHIYLDGLANEGLVIGHWGADDRASNTDAGARTQMVDLGWHPSWGGQLQLRYRTVSNQTYSPVAYERGSEMTLRYSHPVGSFTLGGEVLSGKDVFGEDFSRIAAFVRYSPRSGSFFTYMDSEDDTRGGPEIAGAEIFVDAGANAHQVKVNLSDTLPEYKTKTATGSHVGIGARRSVSDHSDFGVRAEFDDIDGRSMVSVRALDYRYRFAGHLALGAFLGASRYDLETPAYGLYLGAGVQWRDVLPGWDIGAEARYMTSVARDHLLPTDPQGGAQPDSFYNVYNGTLYITRRF